MPAAVPLLSALVAAVLVTGGSTTLAAGPAPAVEASAGTVLTIGADPLLGGFDPHARLPGNALVHGVYEAMVLRRWDMTLAPGLAHHWERLHPQVWRFDLRPGVRFHDGQSLSAADVVYSFHRVGAAYGRHDGRLAGILTMHATDRLTVEVVTARPDPLLPGRLADLYIVDAAWTAAQAAPRPGGEGSTLDRVANGTGPFRLLSRDPLGETVLEPNGDWWGRPAHTLAKVVHRVVPDPADRLSGLIAGSLDLIRPVPLRDLEAVRETPELRLLMAPELRTLLLGMDQWREELGELAGTGRNPFTDRRVREAVALAIDLDALRRGPMQGAARTAGLPVAPGVQGYTVALDSPAPHDPDKARALLAEAGYPSGFPVTLDCPNDRYLNDLEVCRAIAEMLGSVGIDVSLNGQTAARHFEKIGPKLGNYTSLYLLGWTPETLDAHDVLLNVMTLDAGPGSGAWNAGRWSDPAVEGLTRHIAVEMDPGRRDTLIHEALAIHKDAFGHIPLYQQMIVWAVGPRVQRVHLPPEDRIDLRTVRMRRGPAPPSLPTLTLTPPPLSAGQSGDQAADGPAPTGLEDGEEEPEGEISP